MATQSDVAQKALLLVFGILSTAVTSGAVFGWVPLELMLVEDKQFLNLCSAGESSCVAQNVALNNIYSAGSAAYCFSSWPAGYLLDRYGPRFSCCLGAILFSAGSVLFGFADSVSFDVFTPAFILLGCGGPPIVYSFMHLSNLFAGREGLVITLLCVMIDMSAIDFMVLNSLYRLGLSRRLLFIALAVVPAPIFLGSLFLCPDAPYDSPEQLRAPSHASLASRLWGRCCCGGGDDGTDGESSNRFPVSNSYSLTNNSNSSGGGGDELEEWAGGWNGSRYGDIDRSALPFPRQLRSPLFLSSLLFFALLNTVAVLYMGSAAPQLLRIAGGDAATALQWSTAFGWVLPIGGVLVAPLVGYLLDHVTRWKHLAVLGAVVALFQACDMIPNIYAQAATFFFIVLTRAFLYSANAAFLVQVFGIDTYGKLWGVQSVANGVGNSAQTAVVVATLTKLRGNFLWPNAVMLTVVLLATAAFALTVRRQQLVAARAKMFESKPLTFPGVDSVGTPLLPGVLVSSDSGMLPSSYSPPQRRSRLQRAGSRVLVTGSGGSGAGGIGGVPPSQRRVLRISSSKELLP